MRLMPVLLSLLMTTAFLSGCIGNEPEVEEEPESGNGRPTYLGY